MSVRVIAGTARGRPLRVPRGGAVRPTADRVREALFASLGDAVAGAAVLDLWAGAGTLAVEALSRGAGSAVLVERDRRALAALRANLATTGLADRATVAARDVAAFARAPQGGPFALVLADPPYATPTPLVWRVLGALHVAGALAVGAVVSVERDRRVHGREAPGDLPGFLASTGARAYGETVLWRLAVVAQPAAPGLAPPPAAPAEDDP